MDVTPIALLMLFPLLTVIVMKVWRAQQYSWLEAGTQVVLSIICITGFYMGGKYLEMTSVEYWTGYIKSKDFEDGHYVTSYCCATDKDGNCTSTCYTDHYTREWNLYTTVGTITTSSIDTEWRIRRDGFDADSDWMGAYEGEACSRTNAYLNYVQAAKYSLHHRSGTNEEFTKQGLLPEYPQLHSTYKLNRVIDLGVGVPNLDQWRLGLDNYMKNLGALKQINLFVIFVPTLDPSYTAALEAHWRGANKNDTIIVVGVDKASRTIGMVDVITWADDPIYKINLIGELTKHGTLGDQTYIPFLTTVNELTLRNYNRIPMATFEELKNEIDPPLWVLIICIVLAIPGSLVLAVVFDRIDLDAKVFGHRRFRRY